MSGNKRKLEDPSNPIEKRAKTAFNILGLPDAVIQFILKFRPVESYERVCRLFQTWVHAVVMPPLRRLRQTALPEGGAFDVNELVLQFGCVPHSKRYQDLRPPCEVAIPSNTHMVIDFLTSRMWREAEQVPIPIRLSDFGSIITTYEHVYGMEYGQGSMVPDRTMLRPTRSFARWLDIVCTLPELCTQIFNCDIAPKSADLAELESILKAACAGVCPYWLTSGMELVVSGWNYVNIAGQKRAYLAICSLQKIGQCFKLLAVVHSAIGATGRPDNRWQSDYSAESVGAHPRPHFELYTLVSRAARSYCDGKVLNRWQFAYSPMYRGPTEQTVMVHLSEEVPAPPMPDAPPAAGVITDGVTAAGDTTAGVTAAPVALPAVAESDPFSDGDIPIDFDESGLANQPSTPIAHHGISLEDLFEYPSGAFSLAD